MSKMKLLMVWVTCVWMLMISSSEGQGDSRYPLHLIALVPLGNEDSPHCVDRGEELLPAAEIALQTIEDQNILPDFQLKIIPARTNNCTDNSATNSVSLVSFANYSALAQEDDGSNTSITIVGVVGMMCSATMLTISPLASQPGIDFIQITSGNTPPTGITRSREDRVRIDSIFQTAPPSTLYNDAVIALMRHQGWKRINVLRLTDSLIIDHDVIAGDFRDRIVGKPDLSIEVYGEVQTSAILDEIQTRRVRIIYASLPDEEARELLCQGHSAGLVWPQYAWILHDHSLEVLKQPTKQCNATVMAKAVQGVILLYYSLENDRNLILNSTRSYADYVQDYQERLRGLSTGNQDRICIKDDQMFYANALHDSVLAFAKALDDALNDNNLTNSDLENYRLGQGNITKVIREYMNTVSFNGAGGNINFNLIHEVDLSGVGVNICQVDPNGTGKLLHYAFYNGSSVVEITTLNFISGEFDRITKRIPLPLPVVTFVLTIILVVATTIVLALFIYYWNSHDIKATSPLLSLVILAACYMLYFSVLLTAIRVGFSSGDSFAALCLAEDWFFIIGIQLLFSTLFWRLLRVYRIFFNYQKLGKWWSDYALLLYILLVVSISVLLLLLWSVIDRPITDVSEKYVEGGSVPHIDEYLTCRGRLVHPGVWLGLTLGYFALLLILVVALAVMTRKVKIESFKDTKTVNAFIFTTAIVLGFFIAVTLILDLEIRNNDVTAALSYSFTVLYTLVVAVACKAFLFAPKIYFARFPDEARHKTTSFTPTITNNSAQPHSRPRHSSVGQGTHGTSTPDSPTVANKTTRI